MEKVQEEGYVAGVISILVATVLFYSASGSGLFYIFGAFFGILGVASLWKPESIGHILATIMNNMTKNSDSGDKKTSKKTNITHIHIKQNQGQVINRTDSDGSDNFQTK